MTVTLIQRRNEAETEFGRFRDEIERAFETMLSEPMMEPRIFRIQGWMPSIDVSESESELVIRAEVPGIAEKDLDISVVGEALVIGGEKREETETEGEDWRRCERRFGAFRRMIPLPKTVDPERARAEASNGVVTVRIPKKAGVKPRQIEVKPVGVPMSSILR